MTQHNSSSQDPRPKNYIGSALLFIGIFSTATIAGILILITILFPFKVRYWFSCLWCACVLWMAKVFCGLDYEVEGLDTLDPSQPAIILSNHQSAWETLSFRVFLPMQTVLLKKSLLWFPIWGWALAAVKPIAIDRKKQRAALTALLEKGTAYLNQGLWAVIYPEGTRTEAGAVKKFSGGGAKLAQKSGYPVIPVAHNAGRYWPRYSFFKYPGTIKVKIGPLIESKGRTAAEINAEAEAWVRQAVQAMD